MSEALNTWKRKLEHLQQEEAITADPAQRFQLAELIREAKSKIAEFESSDSGQGRSAASRLGFEISRIVKYAPAELIGREDETKLLKDAWGKVLRNEQGRPHVLTFVALGGEGKTSLVAKWAAELASQDWPGCDAAFAWSFYSQGTRDQVAASSDLFLKEALTFFGDDADKAFAASNAGAYEKGQRLARLVGQRRSLLILDGLEPLQYAPTSPTPGQLKDQGIAALLKGLAAAGQGLCVVTTRYPLPDLKAFKDKTVVERELKRLSQEAGVHLLQQLGVRKESGSKADFEKLVEDVKGHALTLTLLGGFLKRAFHGDIRQCDRVRFEKADEKMDGGHAFRTMATYEQWLLRDGGDEGRREVAVLRLMGLFDRPADAGCLNALLQPPVIAGLTEPLVGLAEDDWVFCLTGLEAAKLLTVNRDTFANQHSLDAHPHLREYFAKRVREQNPDAWRAAHRRLYEHLSTTTSDTKPSPTLEDLQPLYQAVAHGCQANLRADVYSKVYAQRIRRGSEYYSTKRLGAYGTDLTAVADFFESRFSRVSPELLQDDQVSLLNAAAVRLRALGRLREALEPEKIGLEVATLRGQWQDAAWCASNLSELEVVMGDLEAATRDGKLAVALADKCGQSFEPMCFRATLADALHQSGKERAAAELFRASEEIQSSRQPAYPLLYGLAGFRYCDLLLAQAERESWRVTLVSLDAAGAAPLPMPVTPRTHLNEFCRLSYLRTAQLARWSEIHPKVRPLDLAFHHLIRARAIHFSTLLMTAGKLEARSAKESTVAEGSSDTATEMQNTIASLRGAVAQSHLPRGLLTRAWLRFLAGARTGPESAQEDLDEAWEIAERGPMRLHMADIHLYRARLFGMRNSKGGVRNEESKYPWESPEADLKAARKLIEQCGYWRRKEELEDAEKAILG